MERKDPQLQHGSLTYSDRAEVSQWLATAPAGASVYLIGAGGCGMSGLGHLLLDHGLHVCGSDARENDAVRRLRARGADIRLGHAAAHLSASRSRLVIYTSAVRRDNPVLEQAQRMGLPLVRRATMLAALMQGRRGVCVAGMHGKTTTTGLLAHALKELGADPSHAVGGHVPQWERSAQLRGDDRFMVVEADESDGTLREFHPEQALVLNVDEEHLDYYANIAAVCAEFATFAAQVSGAVFYCADDPRLVAMFAARPSMISFGLNPAAQYRVEPLEAAADGGACFDLWHEGNRLGSFALKLAGAKNMSNAGAVAAFLHHNGFAVEKIAAALETFRGVARRQQELFRDGQFRIVDDYGHHPREIEATIASMRSRHAGRLLVAFQPHRYTRTQFLLKDFARCFKGADRVWITEVYAASEPVIPEVNGQRLADAVAEQGLPAAFAPTLDDLHEQVRLAMQPGDMVLFLGAGDITQTAHQLAMQCALKGSDVAAALRGLLAPESGVRADEPMARRTTLRVGGPADVFVEPASETDLAKVLAYCHARPLPVFILGRGSNLLVKDGGFRGVVIHLSAGAFSKMEMRGSKIYCGAGVRLKHLANDARNHGLAGFEFLEGIPGNLGGALRMNAGAMGSETFAMVESIRVMDRAGNIEEIPRDQVEAQYRSCPLLKERIALGAVLRGTSASPSEVAARMRQFSEKRHASQPGAKSAGCMFKNPSECPAGKLVDELGLKGTRVGGAVVSDVHGNFIINDGHATAKDVLELITLIQEKAKVMRGIELHTEVQIVGE